MTRAPGSVRARWFGVVIVLGTVFSLVSSPDSIPTGRATFVANFAKLLPSLFPALLAQSIVTGSDNNVCTNGDVASGNQITITLDRLRGRRTNGTVVVFSEEDRSVNLLGAPGTTLADRFFNGLPIPNGTYDQLIINVTSQMTYIGAVTCVIGGQTRYYYSNGSATPPSPFVTSSLTAAAAAAMSTTVTVSGTSEFALNVNYTQDAVIDIAFDPTVAVYDVGGAVYALFPASNATGASAQ